MAQIILASGSSIRAALLTQAGIPFEARPARVDEDAIKAGGAVNEIHFDE